MAPKKDFWGEDIEDLAKNDDSSTANAEQYSDDEQPVCSSCLFSGQFAALTRYLNEYGSADLFPRTITTTTPSQHPI